MRFSALSPDSTKQHLLGLANGRVRSVQRFGRSVLPRPQVFRRLVLSVETQVECDHSVCNRIKIMYGDSDGLRFG